MEVSRGLEGGRTGRFRRRFGGMEEKQGASSGSVESEKGDVKSSETQPSSSTSTSPSRKRMEEVKFEKDDLDWMTGGREAKVGTPLSKAKPGAKGGKKK